MGSSPVAVTYMTNVFKWYYSDEDSRLNHRGCRTKVSLEDKKRIDAKTMLRSTRQGNTNKLVFAHININSLRNKFELLVDQVMGNIDILTSKTKLMIAFPLEIS